mmetsp:Transcript_3427/g.7134  ORF Transcript_3427/g.7134 Transcript_3427/m.7134 type:complete len:219 (+) Transcript_3427:113-769(+)
MCVVCLPVEAVGHVTRLHGEDGAQVASLLGTLGVLLDSRDEGGVDRLLQRNAGLGDGALLGRLRGLLRLRLSRLLGLVAHELTLGLHALLRLGTLEQLGRDLRRVDGRDIDLGRRGDDVARVDAADGDTVVLHGAGDDQRAVLGQLLQDHRTAATEAASEDDGNGAGSAALADGGEGVGLAADLLGHLAGRLLRHLLGSLGSNLGRHFVLFRCWIADQ